MIFTFSEEPGKHLKQEEDPVLLRNHAFVKAIPKSTDKLGLIMPSETTLKKRKRESNDNSKPAEVKLLF